MLARVSEICWQEGRVAPPSPVWAPAGWGGRGSQWEACLAPGWGRCPALNHIEWSLKYFSHSLLSHRPTVSCSWAAGWQRQSRSVMWKVRRDCPLHLFYCVVTVTTQCHGVTRDSVTPRSGREECDVLTAQLRLSVLGHVSVGMMKLQTTPHTTEHTVNCNFLEIYHHKTIVLSYMSLIFY